MRIILNLFGQSATGKSTLAELIEKEIRGIATVDFDVIKRTIPRYDWTRHAEQGREMTRKELADAIQTAQPVLLLMPSPKNEADFELINSLAKTHDYALINIELTAPREVLIERYAYRLANIDPAKKGWKFKTLDEFKAKLEEPYYIPQDTLTFDTSVLGSDEILMEIIQHVQQK